MTNSIKIKHNLLKYFSIMLIAGLIAFTFASCSKDDDDIVPEVPKTEEEIQAELKEELRTTMGFNSNYKTKLYYTGFTSPSEWDASLKHFDQDRSNDDASKSQAPFIVIDKKGDLWFTLSNTLNVYDTYTIKKENDVFTVVAEYNQLQQYWADGQTIVHEQKGNSGFTLTITYDSKTGETLVINETYMNDVRAAIQGYLWLQDRNIKKPVKHPSIALDPNDYIDF